MPQIAKTRIQVFKGFAIRYVASPGVTLASESESRCFNFVSVWSVNISNHQSQSQSVESTSIIISHYIYGWVVVDSKHFLTENTGKWWLIAQLDDLCYCPLGILSMIYISQGR